MPMASDERFHALMEALQGTEAQLQQGEGIYKDLRKSVRRIKILMWVTIVGLVIDLTLSVGLVLGFVNQYDLNRQVDSNQASVHTVECDLNTLLLGVDTPANYAKAPDQQQYVQQFHVLYQNRIQLGCQPPIHEPQTR